MCDEGSDYSSSEVSESTESSSVEATEATAETELYENTDSTASANENESTELYSEEGEPDSEKELNPNEGTPDEVEETDEDSVTEAEEEESDEAEESNEEDAVRIEINENSPYSQEVNDHISSVEELEVYKNAGLVEREVDGRTCLVREDLDLDYVDPASGLTNREIMADDGGAPFDSKTGQPIELHHIGQDFDSPLAELTKTEHKSYYSTLHTKEGESWRQDSKKRNTYNNVHRPHHWIARSKGE